jgi:hypothetical protein
MAFKAENSTIEQASKWVVLKTPASSGTSARELLLNREHDDTPLPMMMP